MSRFKNFDWSLIVVPFILTLISITTIYTITYVNVGSKLTLNQLVYVLIGFGLFFTFTFFDYRHFRSLSWALFLVGIVLLVPLLPSVAHKLPFIICDFNACRWINLGIFQFQVSEVFKLITILLFAALLCTKQGKMVWWNIFFYLILLSIPVLFILAEPDLGTALVILFCGFTLLLYSRFPILIWIVFLILALAAMPIGWSHLKPYQKERIEVFLNPDRDPNKTGYNVRQAEIAVGSGGLFGRGFGKGSQSQLNFLPVAHTDFIFAGYAEASGYMGSIFLIGLYGFLIWRTLVIATIAKDMYGQFIAVGIAAMLFIQVFINIGMNIRLMPVTGIPLPFVSYGGTSLFVNMIALGILQSIVLRHKKLSFN